MKHRPGQRGFDNHEPRAWLAQQTGYQARANAAQANSFECLPFFIGALLVAWQLGAPSARVDGLAVAFVVLRIRSEEHTSELQSPCNLVCRLLLEKKINKFYPCVR